MTLISQRPLSSSTEKIGATKASLSSRSLTALRTAAGTYVVPHPWRFATQLYPNLGLVLAAVPPSSASDSFLPPPCRLRRWAAKQLTHPGAVRVLPLHRTHYNRQPQALSYTCPNVAFVGLSRADCAQTEDAVRSADIFCCAMLSTAPLFLSESQEGASYSPAAIRPRWRRWTART
jgi:hypothetical protein